MEGDNIMPDPCGECDNGGIESWAEATKKEWDKSLTAKEPLPRKEFDTSINVYADNLVAGRHHRGSG